MASLFRAFDNRNFRLLWIGSASAFLGFFTSNVVQSIVAFHLTAQNTAVGFVVFGRGLAQLLLGPIGGAVADRWPKRPILLGGQFLTSAVFFGLAALMATGKLDVFHLTAAGFLVGTTFAFLGPTRSAYVVELVEPEYQGNAIALNQVAANATRVAGPALAGVLLEWDACGPTGAFAVMGALYGATIVTQYLLPSSTARPATPDHGLLADVAQGFRYVRDNTRLRTLVSMFVLTVMLGFPYVTVLPGFAEHQLGLPATTTSILYGSSAVGGLLASLAAARIADTASALAVYRGAGLAFGLSLMLLWTAHSLPVAVVLMFLVGVSSGLFSTLNGAVVVRHTDPRYMGRVMSLTLLAFGAFGLVALPVGALADALGEGVVLALLGASVCLVVALLGSGLASPEALATPESTLNPPRTPHTGS